MCGDFNARLGDNQDVLEKDNDLFTPLSHDSVYEYILQRVSCDYKTVNQHG